MSPYTVTVCSYLQDVQHGLRQVLRQELEVIFVEFALQMFRHVLSVERLELAHGAHKRYPGDDVTDRSHGL